MQFQLILVEIVACNAETIGFEPKKTRKFHRHPQSTTLQFNSLFSAICLRRPCCFDSIDRIECALFVLLISVFFCFERLWILSDHSTYYSFRCINDMMNAHRMILHADRVCKHGIVNNSIHGFEVNLVYLPFAAHLGPSICTLTARCSHRKNCKYANEIKCQYLQQIQQLSVVLQHRRMTRSMYAANTYYREKP